MKKYIIILLAVAILGFTGCEKWLDVNKNPNDATSATPDLILAGVLTSWGTDINSLGATSGGWMGYLAHAGGWSGWYSEKKYEISSSYLNLMGYYSGALNDNRFIRLNSKDNVVYPAITDVVDAWYYSRLVDCYGDVPYTEACQPDKTLTPKYDDQETIYLDLIARLTNAVGVFYNKVNAADASTNAIYTFKNSVDVVFAGDFNKWIQFANTLKLRLVMRLTNVRSAAQLKALMDNTANRGFITATASINPGYSTSSGKQMWLFATYGKSSTGTVTSQNTQYTLNRYMHRKLTLTTDPRLAAFWFAPVSATGGALISILLGTDGDLIAQPNTTVAANYSWVLIAADAAVVSKANTGQGSADRQPIFLASESYFLQAEALTRGVLDPAVVGTTTNAAFRAGITASLVAAKVAAADQTTYLGTIADISGDPLATKVQKIMDEKWIGNFFLNMFESYCDYRRTGLPNPKGLGTNYEMLSYYPGGIIRRQIPRIFPYPTTEFDLNKANVQAAVDKQIQKNGVTFTSDSYPFDARVFWDNAPKTITY
jgi:hypothetical protein